MNVVESFTQRRTNWQKIIMFLCCCIVGICSCKQVPSYDDVEKEILYELLPAIIDSICVDTRSYNNPPPMLGEIIYDENGRYVKRDSSKATKEELKKLAKWKQEMEKIRLDTTKVLYRFNTTLKHTTEDIDKDIEQYFGDTAYYKIEKKQTLLLPLKKDIVHGKFRVTANEHAATDNRLYLSRIIFNESQNLGILDASFLCRGNCGRGYRIFNDYPLFGVN